MKYILALPKSQDTYTKVGKKTIRTGFAESYRQCKNQTFIEHANLYFINH